MGNDAVFSASEDSTSRPLQADSGRAGHIEQCGIDAIPESERYGRPRSLVWLWMTSGISYLPFVIGGGLVAMGLEVWEALTVIVVGNLWWALIGWLAVSGPAAGTPSMVILRAMFGIRGNRVFGAGVQVLIGVFYEVLAVAYGTRATIALFSYFGLELPLWGQWVTLIGVAALSFILPVFGYATILKLAPFIVAAMGAVMVALAVFIIPVVNWRYHASPLPLEAKVPLMLTATAVISATPLGWGSSPDYARYLPRGTRKRSIVLATALGGFIPNTIIPAFGALGATTLNMSAPEASIAEIVPVWFFTVFLVLVAISNISGNVLTAYSTGLATQALGIKVPRVAAVVGTAALATGAAAWMLFFASGFLEALNASLALAAALLGPTVSVFAVDILLRRNRYDGLALSDERPGSTFWYHHGIFWPGVLALLAGTAAAILTITTGHFVGPVAAAVGGSNLAPFAGTIVGAIVYAVLWHLMPPYRDILNRPPSKGNASCG